MMNLSLAALATIGLVCLVSSSLALETSTASNTLTGDRQDVADKFGKAKRRPFPVEKWRQNKLTLREKAYVDKLLSEETEIAQDLDWSLDRTTVLRKARLQEGQTSWACAAAGLLEGQMGRVTPIETLSQEQLADCLQGGDPKKLGSVHEALSFVIARGINSNGTYHVRSPRRCWHDPGRALRLPFSNYYFLDQWTDEALMRLLNNYGPVAVYIERPKNWDDYTGGIIRENGCSRTRPDHSVLLVGYHRSKGSEPYWIIKNSQGPDWGLRGEGIGHLSMKNRNFCGIARFATIVMFSQDP